MINDVLIPKETEVAVNDLESKLTPYENFKIVSQETFAEAAIILKDISSQEKKIKEYRLSCTRGLDESKKKIMDFFRKPEEYCVKIKNLMSKKMSEYSQEQERIRLEQEAKLREQQRKEAEKLEKKADRLEEQGKIEQAEVARGQAAIASLSQPTINTAVEKPQGVKKSVLWKFDILDENLVPREYCSPDSTKIRLQISSLKENCIIPGVRVYSEEVYSSTGR